MPQWFWWYSRSGSTGCCRRQCGSWPNSGVGCGRKSARTPRLSGCQSAPPSVDSNRPPPDSPTYRCLGSQRIDDDRVELAAVRGRVLVAAAPVASARVVVEAGDPGPRDAAVVGAEQPLRRGSGVPDLRLGRVPRRQPERVVDHAAAAGGEGRRRCRLGPVPAAVGRAEDRRAQVPGAGSGKHRPGVAGVGHGVVDDVPEEMRAGQRPVSARRVALQPPQALAGGDVQRHRRGGRRAGRCDSGFTGRGHLHLLPSNGRSHYAWPGGGGNRAVTVGHRGRAGDGDRCGTRRNRRACGCRT